VGWERIQTCVSAGLCAQSVAADSRVCTVPPCAVGQHQCVGQSLQRCNAQRTGFEVVTTCAAGQICDAPNQQCDICAPGSLDCEGDVFVQCGVNGQQEFRTTCGAGLCSSAGGNTGCLQCPVANGFRCDNQGSLFQCSANQQQENQLDVCRTPGLCRANLGQCLDCDPPGSSRCDGAEILQCTSTNQEVSGGECASAELCVAGAQPGPVECEDDQCPVPFQCTIGGEVLVCNAGRTGYVSQSPPVTCATPGLCDVGEPDGCADPVCGVGDTRCDGANQVVEICNGDRSDFQTSVLCSASGAGFSCVEVSATSARCECVPGAYRCVGAGLQECNGAGTAFVDVAGDLDCDGAVRVSCSGTTVVRNTCDSAALCAASPGATCVECQGAGDCSDGLACTSDVCSAGVCQNPAVVCPSDGAFCNGTESCNPGSGLCVSSGNPCSGGVPQCLEAGDTCVQCDGNEDCSGPTPVCDLPSNTCVAAAADAGTP
jgi:hypothetical protein